jgi:hypothetical protein
MSTNVKVGEWFGLWEILGVQRKGRGFEVFARCVCGLKVKRPLSAFVPPHGSSACSSCAKKTHELTGTPEYRAWAAMKSRCYHEDDISYPNYGGRGIKVCDQWINSFEAFLSDMGVRPTENHSLDRYPDLDGNYCPGNCRWATPREQSQNRKSTVFITHNGQTCCITEWERLLGFPRGRIQRRLRRGWSARRALTTPHKPKPHLPS